MADSDSVTTPVRRAHRPLAQALGFVVLVALLQVVLVSMFGWSASRAAPHELPVALAGPGELTAAIGPGLDHARPGAFLISYLPDDASAQAAVRARKVYAALSMTTNGSTLYTAPAASPAAAQLLTQVFTAALAQASPTTQLQVQPLVVTTANDPNGAGIPIALIPIAITSIAAGAVLGLLFRMRRRRILGLLGYAVLAGGLTASELQDGLGILSGNLLRNAAVIGLACLAISAAVAGLASLVGPPGLGLAVLVIFFFGFPFSGATSAWEFAPTPWGHLAQYLPVGALNATLRSVAFFGGAGAATGWLVLGGWAVGGLLVSALRGGTAPAARHVAAA